jgi:hypothetical protein
MVVFSSISPLLLAEAAGITHLAVLGKYDCPTIHLHLPLSAADKNVGFAIFLDTPDYRHYNQPA